MDTVRALFVRSFPEHLSMRWFEEHPMCRIYVKASSSDVFYELEDLRCVMLPFPSRWQATQHNFSLLQHCF